jgi:hypothetical protein
MAYDVSGVVCLGFGRSRASGCWVSRLSWGIAPLIDPGSLPLHNTVSVARHTVRVIGVERTSVNRGPRSP